MRRRNDLPETVLIGLIAGRFACLDLDEEQPLPALGIGKKSYRAIKL
jgi:hypothetical protein